MRPLVFKLDANGRETFEVPPSDRVDCYVLAPGETKDVPVPTSARYVFFSATGDFFARFGGPAAVPVADVADGTASEINPTHRSMDSVGTIGLAAATGCVVSLAWYA